MFLTKSYSQGHVSLRSSCPVRITEDVARGLARICIQEDLPGRDLASVPNKFALTMDPRLVAGHQLQIPILLTLFSPTEAILTPYIYENKKNKPILLYIQEVLTTLAKLILC
jgi:hypothetical protein